MLLMSMIGVIDIRNRRAMNNRTKTTFVRGVTKFIFDEKRNIDIVEGKFDSPVMFITMSYSPNGMVFTVSRDAKEGFVEGFVSNGKGEVVLEFSFSPKDKMISRMSGRTEYVNLFKRTFLKENGGNWCFASILKR